VIFQFALTVVLLAGAGMMMRSFFAAQALNAFVPSEHLFTARLQTPEGKGEHYEKDDVRRQLIERLVPALQALPGVTQAAAGSFLPGAGSADADIEIEGRSLEKEPLHASDVVQTPDYLPTLGLPILLGRGFNEQDGEKGREAAVVTRSFAARYWPSSPALGRRFRRVDGKTPGEWITVIGVCADIVQNPVEKNPAPLMYLPHRQEPWGWMAVLLRTSGDPTALTVPVRTAVQKLDPDLPVADVATLSGALQHDRWFIRVFGTLFAVFALIALLIASVGIYAVVAHSSARRTREIGIRMALGATTSAILRLVLGRGLFQLAVGLVIGLLGAFGATRLMGEIGFLIAVSPNDPLVFFTVSAVLLTLGSLACWLPARRAAALHPVKALREE
jgi:predicted permease